MYPNPAANSVTLEWPGEFKFERLEVVDLVGKVIVSKNISSAYAKYVVNTSDLKDGIYFIRLVDGEKSTSKKIIISR